MAPKSALLTPGLVARKGTATPTQGVPARTPEGEAASPASPSRTEPLNFRVTQDFRRRFKVYAAEHDLTLSELLERAFDALEQSKP